MRRYFLTLCLLVATTLVAFGQTSGKGGSVVGTLKDAATGEGINGAVVELIDKEEFIKDPLDAYENKIFCKGAPLKTGIIWNKEYMEAE